MKVSGFQFLRNGEMLGYPFRESIKSILPIVDEFIISLGECQDNTEQLVREIKDEKIKIIHTKWNNNMRDRGYVYGQQKMISQFDCSGDWAFYLEADEVLHEQDLPKIIEVMKRYKDNKDVEALVFKYRHFYGNKNTYIDSPGWYRNETRIIKNSIRTISPDALFWVVLDKNCKSRYPKAVHTGATIYHYGWVRKEQEMNLKSKFANKYWNKKPIRIKYSQIDPVILKEFKGSHPRIIQDWLPNETGIFKADPDYKITLKDIKYHLKLKIEKMFKIDLQKKHYKLIKR